MKLFREHQTNSSCRQAQESTKTPFIQDREEEVAMGGRLY
jgi:hypothetical protein